LSFEGVPGANSVQTFDKTKLDGSLSKAARYFEPGKTKICCSTNFSVKEVGFNDDDDDEGHEAITLIKYFGNARILTLTPFISSGAKGNEGVRPSPIMHSGK
jgi:hypothetical protein